VLNSEFYTGKRVAALRVVEAAIVRLVEAKRRQSKGRALKAVQGEIEAALEVGWRAQGRLVLKGFEGLQRSWPEPARFLKEGGMVRVWLREAVDEGDLDGIFEEAAKRTFDLFAEPLTEAAGQALASGALGLVGRLGLEAAWDLKNPRAVRYLEAYGGLLVRQLNETTLGDLRTTLVYGLENGWSYTKTARAIQERFRGYYDTGSWWNFDAPRPQGHIASRAHLVAVTESGNAYEAGSYMVVEDLAEAGMRVEKRWSTVGDDKVSEGCRENEAEGWIAAEQAHKSGDMHPLRFPGCRCDELYEVKEA
jgi:hypothetical protein